MTSNNTKFVARHRWLMPILAIAAAVVLFRPRGPGGTGARGDGATRHDSERGLHQLEKLEPLQNFEAHAPVGTTQKRDCARGPSRQEGSTAGAIEIRRMRAAKRLEPRLRSLPRMLI